MNAPLNPITPINVENSILRGVAVVATTRVIIALLQVATVAILSRLLEPADFGIAAMAMSVIGVAGLVSDLGLSLTTLRTVNQSAAQSSNLFWFNVWGGLVASLFAVLVSPLVGHLFSDPRAAAVTPALGLAFLINSLAAQSQAAMRRNMQFNTLGRIATSAKFVASVATIALAIGGANYWSLIIGQLLGTVASAAMVWRVAPIALQRPRLDSESLAALQLGGSFLLGGFFAFSAHNVHIMLIGATLGATAIGTYARAQTLVVMTMGQMMRTASAVLTPAIVHLGNDPEALRQRYLKVSALAVFAVAPLAAFYGVFAREIIDTLLGEQWDGSIPILQALAVAMYAQAIDTSNGWLLMARARGRDLVRWHFARALTLGASCLIGLHWGPVGVAFGVAVSAALFAFPGMQLAFRGTQIRVIDQLRNVWKPMFASLIAAAVLAALRATTPQLNGMPNALAGAALFLALYLALMAFVFGELQMMRGLMAKPWAVIRKRVAR